MTLQQLVEAVKAHAHEHYNNGGWDVIVECWEDQEIGDLLTERGATTTDEAITAFRPLVSVWADRQADSDNSAF